MSRLVSMLAAAACLQLLGCGFGGEPDREGAAAAPADSELPAAAGAASESLPGRLPPGEVLVELAGDGISVFATDAPRLAVLRRVTEAAGITLVLGELEKSGYVSMDAAAVPVETVIAQVLQGVPYELRYEAAGEDTANRLTTVTVGDFKSHRRRLARERRTRFKERREQRLARRGDREARSPQQPWDPAPASPQRRAELDVELARNLEDSDFRVRAETLRAMPIDSPLAKRVVDLLTSDPSPEVRIAAVEHLAASDAASSINGLLWGLRDPDPNVVLAVIDALEFSGDGSIVPQLEALGTSHPSADVRKAAADAAEFLR